MGGATRILDRQSRSSVRKEQEYRKMQIQPVSSTPTDPIAAASGAASTSSTATTASTDATAALGNENTFLQLMVAQLKNQDPTQPVDSTTFLTQLAQFSSLEQLININQGVQTLDTGSTASNTTTPPNGTSQTPAV
jgi:flagellar basal-body rod modification protein FlgD